MTACIQNWLLKRLNTNINLDPDVAGGLLYDGSIYFKLLQSYNYLSFCQKYEKPKDPISALRRLRELSLWFNMIGVTHDDLMLRKIAYKDGTQAVRLLYDLFLALENKDDSMIIYPARTKEPFIVSTDKFQVEAAKMLGEKKAPSQKQQVIDGDNCLLLTAAEQKEIADTFKEQKDRIREKTILECFKRRTMARTRLSIKVVSDIDHHIADHVSARTKVTREDAKMKLQQTTEGEIECSPEEYLYLLRLWRRKANANELRNKKTQSKLLHTLWQHMIKEQTEEFHNAFCDKLLQQSTFEKSLASRLNRMHNTYEMFCETSATIKSQIEAQAAAADNFNEVYKVLHEYNEEEAEERRRVYELHRRLYDEKMRKRREMVYMICNGTAIELVEFALKYAQYVEVNNEPVPRKLILEWKDYFYKGVCKLTQVSGGESPCQSIEEEEEEYSRESTLYGTRCECYGEVEGEDTDSIKLDECTKNLNDQDVHSYKYLTGPWFLEKLLPERKIENPSLLITGFIMHRLLEAKYPFPAPPTKPDLMEYQLKAVVTPFNESGLVNKLRQLVNEYEHGNVAVIEMTDAINHCVNIYKKEKTLSKVGVSLRDKTDKKKTEEKDEKGKTTAPDKSGTVKKKGAVGCVDEAVQVPSEEDLLASMAHTRAGLLGKLAFEELHVGKKLSDIHLINMMIEYLKTLENICGWVLVNYPMTFEQAALLEYILEGNLIPTPRKLLEEAEHSIEEQEPLTEDEPLIDPKTLKLFEDEIENLRELSLKQLEAANKENALGFLGLDEDEMTVDEEAMFEDELMEEEDLEVPSICKIKSLKELLRLRTSQILPRPNKITYFSESKSYFTKYISLEKQKSSFRHRMQSYTNPHYPVKIMDPLPFYKIVGIAETVTYKKIDVNIVKNIANIIMIDDEESLTYTESTITITTPTVSKAVDEEEERLPAYSKPILSSFTGTTGTPDKTASPATTVTSISDISVKSCKPVGGEAHLLNIQERKFLLELKDSGVPDLEKFIARKAKEIKFRSIENEGAEEEGEEELEEEEMQLTIIYPGEENWQYCQFNIPISLQRSLASIWESVENSYLNNLSEIFLIYRKLDSTSIPYKMYIRKTCNAVINSPDNKQAAVSDFQLMLNYIEAELRSNDEMKAELHCRAFELFNELTEICDERKRIAEETRREIISQNWVAHQAYTLVNLAITLMQIEIDRFMDTLQILYDYYIASLQKIPVEKKLEKMFLEKVKYPETGFTESYDISDQAEKVDQDLSNCSVPYSIELILLNEYAADLPNPVHVMIVDSCNSASEIVRKIKQYYNSIIKSEYQLLLDQQLLQKELEEQEKQRLIEDEEELLERELTKKGKTRGSKRQSKRESKRKSVSGEPSKDKKNEPVAGKKGNQKEKPIDVIEKPIDFASKILEGPYNDLFWEWSTALQEEFNRILLRIQLIESRFKSDLDEIVFISKNAFEEFTKEITFRYHNEVMNVHLLLNLFKAAIEEGQVIKPMIVLDKDDFFVDGGTMMHPEIPPPPPTPLEEPALDFVFSIKQLTNIMDKLNAAAPDGIVEDSLVLILEDMLVFGSECGNPYLPKGWSALTNIDIRTLVECSFAESAMIDWKDFLIFGLNIEFPTIEDLLDARNQLIKFDPNGNETIGWNNFQSVFLWFENEIHDTLHKDLRVVLMKEFLFKLYSINNNEMNYSAMLMAFCKDEDQAEGFAKALSLVSGKPFIVTARELYICEDEFHLDAPYVAEYITDLLLQQVMYLTEGVIITEEESYIELNKYEYFLNKLDVDREAELEEYANEERRIAMEEYETETRVEDTFWLSLVPYDMALALIMYYLHFHPFSCDHIYRQLKIADELKELYLKKGRWNVIRIFDLLDSDLMNTIFNATNMLRAVNISAVVEKMVKGKSIALPSSPIKRSIKFPTSF